MAKEVGENMSKRKMTQNQVQALLNHASVRRAYHEGQTYYCVTDLIRVLAQTQFPEEYWNGLKKREPALVNLEICLEIEREGQVELMPTVDAAGVFRLIQSIAS